MISPSAHAALRARIVWLCYLTRAAAGCWAAWVLLAVVWMWSDPAKLASNLGYYLNADLSALTPSEFAWACGVHIAAWTAVAYCIWRLFGTYLGGRIFTADAAAWLEHGVAGLIAVSIMGRRIDCLVLTSHAELPLARACSHIRCPGRSP
jgi:hypothetical protein